MKDENNNIEDKIDWKIIDQLHSATSRFSSASVELKKMHFILLGILIPTIIKLSGNKLDFSLFVTVYLISLTFWYLDSFTYFHQENLREKMDERFQTLKNRNSEKNNKTETYGNDEFTLDNSRKKDKRLQRAAFDSSLRIYHISVVLTTIAFFFYLIDWI